MKTMKIAGILIAGMISVNALASDFPRNIPSASLNSEQLMKYELASQNFMYEEYQKALPEFLELLKSDPENLDFNYHVGMCYFFLKDEKKAEPYLEKASEDRSLKVRIMFLKRLADSSSIIL